MRSAGNGMKHILFVIDTLRMGGAEKSLVSLLKALDPQRVQVDLYLFEGNGVLRSEVPDWVRVIEADPLTRAMTLELRTYFGDLLKGGHFAAAASRLMMTLRSRLAARKGASSFGWGSITRHIPNLEGHYDAAVGYLEGFADFFVLDKVTAARKIGWIHTDMSKRWTTPEEAAYYQRFDVMATISDICLNGFCERFPAAGKTMRVVENIVLPQEVREKADIATPATWAADRTHLITVGRLDYHKGIDVGARACKVLKDRGIDVCWHVFGKGIMHDEIAAYVAENGLEENFLLEGLTSNPYPYMKRADLLVQPSRVEGKSIVLDEAKILGKAIVVTNYPSVYDQIEDGVTGIITGMEPEQIADGIQRVLGDAGLRKTLEENCFRQPNQSIRALNEFYEMIGA